VGGKKLKGTAGLRNKKIGYTQIPPFPLIAPCPICTEKFLNIDRELLIYKSSTKSFEEK
jgi:hypothetical protein